MMDRIARSYSDLHRDDPRFDVLIVGSGYGASVCAARIAQAAGGRLRIGLLERGREFTPGSFAERLDDLPNEVAIIGPDTPWSSPSELDPSRGILGEPDGLFQFRVGRDVSALVANGLGGGSLINAAVVESPHPEVFRQPQWPHRLRAPGALDEYMQRARQTLAPQRFPHSGPAHPSQDGAKRTETAARDEDEPSGEFTIRKFEALSRIAPRDSSGRPRVRTCDVAINFLPPDARAAGWPSCVGCGNCVTGCNLGAKGVLTQNYLALAARHGVQIYTGVHVASFGQQVEGRWPVDVRPTGAERDATLRALATTLSARILIIAAGTYGSTELMLRSDHPMTGGDRSSRFSPRLGERFSTNGDMIGVVHREARPVDAVAERPASAYLDTWADGAATGSARDTPRVGPTIVGMIDLRDGPDVQSHLVIEDGAIPWSLQRVFGEIVTTARAIHGLIQPSPGALSGEARDFDPLAVSAIAMKHTQVLLSMGHDGCAGRLALSPDSPPNGFERADVRWPDVQSRKTFALQAAWLQRHARAGGGVYLPNPLTQWMPSILADIAGGTPGARLADTHGPAFTVHPLGGCPMGDSFEQGVVDDCGRVWRNAPADGTDPREASVHPGLYVMDGSVIPGSLGINPLLTICALAERAAEAIGQDLGLPHASAAAAPASPALPEAADRQRLLERLVREWRRDPAPSQSLTVRFEERMRPTDAGQRQALLTLVRQVLGKLPEGPVPSTSAEVALEVRFEVADLDRFLADESQRRGMVVECALLESRPEHPLQPADSQPIVRRWQARDASIDLMSVVPEGAPRRIVRALLTLLGERSKDFSKGQLWAALRHPVASLRLLARNGTQRTMRYRARFVTDDGGELWLSGIKSIAYRRGVNPWLSLITLETRITTPDGSDRWSGQLRQDVVDLLRNNRLPQVLSGQPAAEGLMGVLAYAGLFARVMIQTYLWAFRLPDRTPEITRPTNPGPYALTGVDAPEVHWVTVEDDPALRLRLVRYRATSGASNAQPARRHPLICIHGFATSSNLFCHPAIRINEVQALTALGFEVWVADVRTSINLESSGSQWDFDCIARNDVRALIDRVIAIHYRDAPADADRRVDIHAHCMGAAIVCMAQLSGRLHDESDGRPLVRRMALSQVTPYLMACPGNQLRAEIAGFLRDGLGIDMIEPTDQSGQDIPPSQWLERLASTVPLKADQVRARAAHCPAMAQGQNNRITFTIGQLWQMENLLEPVYRNLTDFIGRANMKTFWHIAYFAKRSRVVGFDGGNIYATNDRLRRWFAGVDVLTLYGERSEMFEPVSTSLVVRRLKQLLPGCRASADTIEGAGHLDILIGDQVNGQTFRKIADFLSREDPPPHPADDEPDDIVLMRPPRCGPVIGATNVKADRIRSRVWFELEDESTLGSGEPVALVAAARDRAELLSLLKDPRPAFARSRLSWAKADHLTDPVHHALARIDHPVPSAGESLWVLCASAHRMKGGDPAAMEWLVDSAGAPMALTASTETTPAPPREILASIVAVGRWIERLPEERWPVAEFDPMLIRSLDPGSDHLRVLVMSCASPGTAVHQQARLSSAQHFAQAAREPGACSHLLMMGDQIYADDTAEPFNARSRREIAWQRYREFFTLAPIRPLLARTPSLAMLDDHEIYDNFAGIEGLDEDGRRGTADALLAYRAFQDVRAPQRTGTHFDYPFELGPLRGYMLDTRSERNRPTASLLSREQKTRFSQWLEDAMRERALWQSRHPGQTPAPLLIGSAVMAFPRPKDADPGNPLALEQDSWWFSTRDLAWIVGRLIDAGATDHLYWLAGDVHAGVRAEVLARRGDRQARFVCLTTPALFTPYPFTLGRQREHALEDRIRLADPQGEIDLRVRTHAFVEQRERGHLALDIRRDGSGWGLRSELVTDLEVDRA